MEKTHGYFGPEQKGRHGMIKIFFSVLLSHLCYMIFNARKQSETLLTMMRLYTVSHEIAGLISVG